MKKLGRPSKMKNGAKIMNLYISMENYLSVKKLSEETGRTMSNIVNEVLEKELKK